MTLKDYKHNWYLKNKEKILAKQDKFKKENPEIVKARAKKSREKRKEKNPNASTEATRKFRLLHPERDKELKDKWKKNNPEKRKIAQAKYTKNNLDKHRINQQNRRARKINSGGNGWTAQEEKELKESYSNRCVYCNQKLDLTMDHVVPLVKGGVHSLENIAPACGKCNSQKGTTPLLRFLYNRLSNS